MILSDSGYSMLTQHDGQVLHVLKPNSEVPVVFVADYSENPSLPPLPDDLASSPWAWDLDGRILQIALHGDQKKFVDLLLSQPCLHFRKLHMTWEGHVGNVWMRGCKDAQLLFDKLNVKKPNEELAALQRCVACITY